MENRIVQQIAPGTDNPRNSEGAFATLADGRLLFAYSRYRGTSGSDHAPAIIAGRYSADGGRTWDAADRILVDQEGQCNVMSVSLQRLHDGRLAMLYLRKNSFLDCRPYLRYSSDEAETWSEPVLCIPAPGYFVVNNDRMIQLRSGRLVIPAGFHRAMNELPVSDRWTSDHRSIAMFYYSDDAGATWTEAADWWALPVRSRSGMQEPGVVELGNGKLYAWARTNLGRQWEMTSSDHGDHWTPPRPSRFQSPCSPLSIKRLPGGDLVAVWNDHRRKWPVNQQRDGARSAWGRSPLTIAVSRDDGQRWRFAKLLEDNLDHGYCYIAIHPLEDALLLAYCSGKRSQGQLNTTTLRRLDYDYLYSRDA